MLIEAVHTGSNSVWTVFFMKKLWKRIMICGLLAVFIWTCFLAADHRKLCNNLIRFHVVAHSDGEEDQAIKLSIRDAVLNSMREDMQKIRDIDEAKKYLQENLPEIQQLVDQSLKELGFQGSCCVTLRKERFDIRHYDTFSLPAGIYDSLRIVIGDGSGKNWWCVSFPSLCIPATTSGFKESAVSAGFTEPLAETLSGNGDYKIRFYFLNQFGKLQNIFFQE